MSFCVSAWVDNSRGHAVKRLLKGGTRAAEVEAHEAGCTEVFTVGQAHAGPVEECLWIVYAQAAFAHVGRQAGLVR